MVLVLTVVILQSISFSNYALTTKTTNIIYGSAPYLTFDGGRTRVTNTEALLRISLSDGRTFTPTTNNSSSTNPIELPVTGQSFADIGMLVPTNTNSIALSSLIGTPYNYWGDDDGDGQGINGITATGSLNLSIVDKGNNRVARNEVLTICKAPYKLTLSNDGGTLKTRYGVPNESRFSAGYATYYINPKVAPVICYARPYLGGDVYDFPPATVMEYGKGFLPQSVTPSSYGSNFPTTGANNLYFDLDIGGNNQALSWATVSHGGITATMTNSTSTSVRVTLRGPVATSYSNNPGQIARPSLPQTFELVGRDSSGNAVVKYGFVLKQWFVSRGNIVIRRNPSSISSWCNSLGGYRMPKVKDLTNATCRGGWGGSWCQGAEAATPSADGNYVCRHIGAGLLSEWGILVKYPDANFGFVYQYMDPEYWTQDRNRDQVYRGSFRVRSGGAVTSDRDDNGDLSNSFGICVYP
ncbi:hypothetical protein B6C97_11040 [Gilliamella apis]|uniref:hypothetical protein n=1 Tax=Gilliamella apis TaxID=1970738 RepID=UPI000A35BB4E|nr:hypothetical protein [Gilliamella apis]OTQ41532.1 hypothetical protein B6D26_02160 [Gilliamella apis]OTQ44491.1 hypothetical protein B6C86_10470 [Gilliamella apis]OTQ47867.1 hypothetical protein B6C92_10550 [Gilliamella apis]OTQ52255.1 hypothetical protein B6C96_02320 [Gilliamella apis]OTQ55584.1 hypothetical protein B6C97_11040 [Gilliamella apis]